LDVGRVNSVLVRAISEFQDSELVGLAEATIGGYKVPSPGDLDTKIHGKKSESNNKNKWVEKTIHFEPAGGLVRTEDAWVRGVWAVHPDSRERRWEITHVPAGIVVSKGLDSKMVARATVDKWIARSPAMLKLGVNKGPDQKADVLRMLRKHRKMMNSAKLRDVRFVS
jgi:hypothetical protein